jgi:UDP-2,3-diacylglucosamine pyrophosphatase LpxH
MLRALRAFKPDIVVILGDFADCESLSAHAPSTAHGRKSFKLEVDEVSAALKQIEKAAPNAERYYVKGNHENRLERFLAKNAAALFDCVNYADLLKLKERGWKVTEYKKTLKLGKLHITHDTGKSGKDAHRSSALTHMGSTIIGHTHRMAYDVKGKYGGDAYVAAMFGWLGDSESVDYMHQSNVQTEWVHGFGLGWLEENDVLHVQPVPIVRGACIVEGKLIR